MQGLPTLKRQADGRFAPGHSGNPRGPKIGTRRQLATDFVADLYESWKTLGKPAILAMAWTDPGAYVRVVAGLMPKEIEATVTVQIAERMSDDELASIAVAGRGDPLEAQSDEEILQRVG
jgi:hypothetical protein